MKKLFHTILLLIALVNGYALIQLGLTMYEGNDPILYSTCGITGINLILLLGMKPKR